MKLYDHGVFLVNGNELVEDTPDAAEKRAEQLLPNRQRRRRSHTGF